MADMSKCIDRFIEPQKTAYPIALEEVRNGRTVSHWMWYIFPQLKGLGRSATAEYYGIQDIGEARAFLADPYLGANLRCITQALLDLNQTDPTAVLGWPDDMKLRSSMTLFACAAPDESLFRDVIGQYFGGRMDGRTLRMLQAE